MDTSNGERQRLIIDADPATMQEIWAALGGFIGRATMSIDDAPDAEAALLAQARTDFNTVMCTPLHLPEGGIGYIITREDLEFFANAELPETKKSAARRAINQLLPTDPSGPERARFESYLLGRDGHAVGIRAEFAAMYGVALRASEREVHNLGPATFEFFDAFCAKLYEQADQSGIE